MLKQSYWIGFLYLSNKPKVSEKKHSVFFNVNTNCDWWILLRDIPIIMKLAFLEGKHVAHSLACHWFNEQIYHVMFLNLENELGMTLSYYHAKF